ncbi:hypothetical protein ACIQ62_01570 [Streptomyces sp. NPDC096319]|uniref:hypothetical protein n=1 Tax=Streptomyces sp. NPDC096319 TaxID=3366084 RepID=UPI0038051F6E
MAAAPSGPSSATARWSRSPSGSHWPPELVPVPGGHVVLDQILMHAQPAAFALR